MAGRSDRRSAAAHEYQGLYKTARWQKLRAWRLTSDPICAMCIAYGKVTSATVVDHISAHRGDPNLFYDPENTQSLCKGCHDSAKQSEERLGYSPEIGLDGWPVDKKHPFLRNTHGNSGKKAKDRGVTSH